MIIILEIEKKIGYEFKDKSLLETALTHSSYANEHKVPDNERLEFLGDSVLSVIISEHIYKRLNDVKEGDLSKSRAILVCEASLSNFAKKLSINKYLRLGKGEDASGGRMRASITSDAFEAILAAIFLDAGIERAKQWVLEIMNDSIEEVIAGKGYEDYKTILQEKVQKGDKGKVTYRTVAESGADHIKSFAVEVMIDGEVVSRGTGRSKKDAEQHAARLALKKMHKKELKEQEALEKSKKKSVQEDENV